MSFPYISIDIETCGLDEDTCDILEFGAILDDLSVLAPIETLPRFHCYFIKDTYVGEPTALSMHPVIFKRIADRCSGFKYIHATKFGFVFKQFLVDNGYSSEQDKVTVTVAGKNFAAFDLQFLKRKTDLYKHVKIRSRILDPAILFLEPTDHVLPGTADCLERAGIERDVMHDAINDAIDVVQLVRSKLGGLFCIQSK